MPHTLQPGRRNIVISRSKVPGVEHYHNIDDAVKFLQIDPACWTVVEKSALPGNTSLTNVVYRRVDGG